MPSRPPYTWPLPLLLAPSTSVCLFQLESRSLSFPLPVSPTTFVPFQLATALLLAAVAIYLASFHPIALQLCVFGLLLQLSSILLSAPILAFACQPCLAFPCS